MDIHDARPYPRRMFRSSRVRVALVLCVLRRRRVRAARRARGHAGTGSSGRGASALRDGPPGRGVHRFGALRRRLRRGGRRSARVHGEACWSRVQAGDRPRHRRDVPLELAGLQAERLGRITVGECNLEMALAGSGLAAMGNPRHLPRRWTSRAAPRRSGSRCSSSAGVRRRYRMRPSATCASRATRRRRHRLSRGRHVRERRGLQGARAEEAHRARLYDPAQHGRPAERSRRRLRRAYLQAAEPCVLPAIASAQATPRPRAPRESRSFQHQARQLLLESRGYHGGHAVDVPRGVQLDDVCADGAGLEGVQQGDDVARRQPARG